MSQSEHEIQNLILLSARELGYTLWRNNTGVGWQGNKTSRRQDGAMIVQNARPLHAGLCKGSSDLIGLRSRVITPDDVGECIAQFVALEVKAAGGRLSHEQVMFLDFIKNAGGIARVVRSVEDAK
ncbi:VRR-NUC domain-containing protein [Rhodoferax sp. 4810]|uniref:VRR-NUC domain-containing protein n=1 Tax=Thiospirillum jenense TaxID=1653858 RepID=A0A839H9H4_9GAMM|nr:VRR-NUC domain-containing protein [Thiospirillum jenense]MBB1074492.1 VRR-NUC domain-containing protein [Rhodoferax jenense]MBB1125524.1 VRR-NUC domain-containing protein [Thiospirillum jenense]